MHLAELINFHLKFRTHFKYWSTPLLTVDLVKILQELDVQEQYVVKPLMSPHWDVSIKLFGSAVLEHVRLLSEISNQLQVRYCVLLNIHDEFIYLSPRSLMHNEVIKRLIIYILFYVNIRCSIHNFLIRLSILYCRMLGWWIDQRCQGIIKQLCY